MAIDKNQPAFLAWARAVEKELEPKLKADEARVVAAKQDIASIGQALKRTYEIMNIPHGKLRAMRALADAGVPVGVMVAPVIPMITDHELEHILRAAHAHGARAAGYVLLRLPHELKQVWREWLQLHYPERAAHVMSLIQQMRGGKDYDSRFGVRSRGEGPFAQLLAQRFQKAHARLGFGRLPALDASKFVAPLRPSPQGDLFRRATP